MMKKTAFTFAAVCAALSLTAISSAQPPPKKDGANAAPPPPNMERQSLPVPLSEEAQKQIKEHSDAIRAIMEAETARIKAEWNAFKELVDAYRKDTTNEEAKAKLAKAIGDKYDAEMARRQEAFDEQKASKDEFVNKQLEFIAKGDKAMEPLPPPQAGERMAPQARDRKGPRGWGHRTGAWERGARHGWGWGHRKVKRMQNCPNGDMKRPAPQGCFAPGPKCAPAPGPKCAPAPGPEGAPAPGPEAPAKPAE